MSVGVPDPPPPVGIHENARADRHKPVLITWRSMCTSEKHWIVNAPDITLESARIDMLGKFGYGNRIPNCMDLPRLDWGCLLWGVHPECPTSGATSAKGQICTADCWEKESSEGKTRLSADSSMLCLEYLAPTNC